MRPPGRRRYRGPGRRARRRRRQRAAAARPGAPEPKPAAAAQPPEPPLPPELESGVRRSPTSFLSASPRFLRPPAGHRSRPPPPSTRARRAPTALRGAGRRSWTCGLLLARVAAPRPFPLVPALAPALPALRAPRAGPARGWADMGAKQSGPAAANGRTRAYSGSDLPSSSSGGANGTAGGGGGGGGGGGARAAAPGRFPAQVSGAHQPSASGGAAAASAAPRSRSLGGAGGSVASAARAAQSSFNIPNSSSGPYGSQDSVHSSPEDGGGSRDRPAGGGPGGPRLVIGSLPAHLSPHMFGGTAPSPLRLPGSLPPAGGTWAAAALGFYPSPFLLQPERRGFASRPARLSGEEKRRLTLAAPLPLRPGLWVLDTGCTPASEWVPSGGGTRFPLGVKGAKIVFETNRPCSPLACGFLVSGSERKTHCQT